MSLVAYCSTALIASVLGAITVPEPCSRTDRFSLSGPAAQVLTSIEADSEAIANSPVPLNRLLSTCNKLESVRIDGPAIFTGARDIISMANHEVDIAMFVWESDSQAARLIGDGLIAAQARRTSTNPLLVRIVVDEVEELSVNRTINNLWNSQKDWINRGLDTSRVVLQLATAARATFAAAAMHDKVIVVDGRWVLVTGANVERIHDAGAPWHDTGYIVQGDAAQSALAAFDGVWTNDRTYHWHCATQSFSFDCNKRTHYLQPKRSWMPAFGTQRPGHVPVLAVGRNKQQLFFTSTRNPQDIAWLTAMSRATSQIHIESPNINDDAFQGAVLAAVNRGVTVRLITSMGFNDAGEDAPSLGGDNLEIAARLRQAVRNLPLSLQERLQFRWYSYDGINPVTENGPRASHTKFMTVDGMLGIVGSGNQDTVSWDISHEFNLLLDEVNATSYLDNALFYPDWNRAITSYLEFYEGNSGTQDAVCAFAATRLRSVEFYDPPFDGTDWRCNNDEARSVLLHDIAAGSVFRLYDDPGGMYQDDDWTEIIAKRAVSRKYIDSFEQAFEDDDVRVIHHRDNGLDGKVSRVEVVASPTGAVVDLYEGNGASQNLVCSNRVTGTRSINLTTDSYCNNDEARSLMLYDFPTDKVLFVYDSSSGSTGDDWAVIVPQRFIKRAVVGSFESSFTNADVRVCAFYRDNLDGKVSRVRIGDRSEAYGLCGVTAPPPPPPTATCGNGICESGESCRTTGLAGQCQSDCGCCSGWVPVCFVAGTAVSLADGSTKPIERVAVGDVVLSYDEATGTIVHAQVSKTFEHTDVHTSLVEVDGHLQATADHPFYVRGRKEPVRAADLRPGDQLITLNGLKALAPRRVTTTRPLPAPGTVYNIEVNGPHNYFAAGVLVHNKTAVGGCQPADGGGGEPIQ
ncbi:MAG TPA: phospholipase D-like domain-containing protein [Thermoanaerobaculia bacterium]